MSHSEKETSDHEDEGEEAHSHTTTEEQQSEGVDDEDHEDQEVMDEHSELLTSGSREVKTKPLPCDALMKEVSEEGYNLSWENLRYTVQKRKWFSLKPPFCKCFHKPKSKTILYGLSGFAAAGTP